MRNNKHLCTNLARLLYSYTESEEHIKPVTVKTYLNERFQCLKSLRHKLCILSINHPNTLNYEYYKQYMWNFRSHSICRCTPCSLIHFNHKIPKVSRSLQEQHITGGDCCCGFLLWQKVNILYLGLLCFLRVFLYVFIEQHPSQKTIETCTL